MFYYSIFRWSKEAVGNMTRSVLVVRQLQLYLEDFTEG